MFYSDQGRDVLAQFAEGWQFLRGSSPCLPAKFLRKPRDFCLRVCGALTGKMGTRLRSGQRPPVWRHKHWPPDRLQLVVHGGNIVAPEHRIRPVTGHRHCHGLRDAPADHVPGGRSPQVVEKQASGPAFFLASAKSRRLTVEARVARCSYCSSNALTRNTAACPRLADWSGQ
jgi:hypothetical protein